MTENIDLKKTNTQTGSIIQAAATERTTDVNISPIFVNINTVKTQGRYTAGI